MRRTRQVRVRGSTRKKTVTALPLVENSVTPSAKTEETKMNNDDIEIEFDDEQKEDHNGIDNDAINDTMNDTMNETVNDINDSHDSDSTPDDEKSIMPDSSRKIRKSMLLDRKGPGRPRKLPKKDPIPRKGVSTKPMKADNVVEFLYDSPVFIKKVIGFFKSVAATHIQIIFRPTNIVFYARDHHKMSKIRVLVDANKLNHYYCKSQLDIGITTKELESVINKIDKDYESVIILSNTQNTQKYATFILENSMQIDEIHNIDLIGTYDRLDNEEEFNNENYMIQFEWPSKYFRKTINDIKTFGPQLSIIQNDKSSQLMFEYTSLNKKTYSKHAVKNPAKIKLKSKLVGDDSFRVDIKVDHIKPISSAHIADNVMILVDEQRQFMTKAYLDQGTIEIKTLTSIINQNLNSDEDL